MPARPTAATTRPAPRTGARADARAPRGDSRARRSRRGAGGASGAGSRPAGRLASRGAVLAALAVLLVLAVIASLAAGAALAASGAAMQGITRNPLADPGLLGVNAGATTAVVLATGLLGLATPGAYLVSALLGAAIAFVFVWTVASLSPTGASPLTLVLAGAATAAGLSAVAGAVSLVKVNDLESTRRWQTGIVSGRTWDLIVPALVVMAVGLVLVLSQARVLDALAMGEDVATGLGVPVVRGRAVAALGAVALCSGATALAGPIGFVGIMAPHLMRLLGGPAHAWTITAGAPPLALPWPGARRPATDLQPSPQPCTHIPARAGARSGDGPGPPEEGLEQ